MKKSIDETLKTVDFYVGRVFRINRLLRSRYRNLAVVATFLLGVALSLIPGVVLYKCTKYFEKREAINLYSIVKAPMLREAVNNVRTLQFYYWSLLKKWTPHSDMSRSDFIVYSGFLSHSFKDVYEFSNTADIVRLYEIFRKADEKILQMKAGKYVSKEGHMQYLDFFKSKINECNDIIKRTAKETTEEKLLNESYIKEGWDREDILEANCMDFLNTQKVLPKASTNSEVRYGR
jgi:hypothetical protein